MTGRTFPQDIVFAELPGSPAELAVAVHVPALVGQRHAQRQSRTAQQGAAAGRQRQQRGSWETHKPDEE